MLLHLCRRTAATPEALSAREMRLNCSGNRLSAHTPDRRHWRTSFRAIGEVSRRSLYRMRSIVNPLSRASTKFRTPSTKNSPRRSRNLRSVWSAFASFSVAAKSNARPIGRSPIMLRVGIHADAQGRFARCHGYQRSQSAREVTNATGLIEASTIRHSHPESTGKLLAKMHWLVVPHGRVTIFHAYPV